jgi:tRNA nucleotidyltransferase (CCA-adding enzyme)
MWQMNIYLVGGAVRDELLGYPFSERDWVVVGATPEEMLNQGFSQVGRDFPVFLHPKTKEEYALARTERKQGVGYTGFAVFADPSVSLEDDLLRRDLTINAIAKSSVGEYIDPYGGLDDIEHRVLRHISPAFAEDPLRVLRVARFAARYAHLGFTVAEDTLALMSELCRGEELLALSPERVWRETEKALSEKSPRVFFEVLRTCGGLNTLFPELDALFGVPQNPVSHPEIDCGIHSLMVLEQAALLSGDSAIRYAALVHDLGKAATPPDQWPRHQGHEQATLPLLASLADRIKVPNRVALLAQKVAKFHTVLHGLVDQSPALLQTMLVELGVYRQGGMLNEFILCCLADHRGRTGFEEQPYPQAEQLRSMVEECCALQSQTLIEQGFEGKAIGEQLTLQRKQIISQFLIKIG